MKKSTTFALVAIGIASLCATVALPASADDNTPVTNGTGNCSTARDQAPNKKCLTKPKEGQKPIKMRMRAPKSKSVSNTVRVLPQTESPVPLDKAEPLHPFQRCEAGIGPTSFTLSQRWHWREVIYLGSAGILAYFGSCNRVHSTALQSGRGGGGRK